MDKTKKLTLEALIARKAQREADKLAFKEVYVDALEGSLTLKKLPAMRFAAMMGKYDSENFVENLEFEVELVYASCPMLQDKGLQEAYGVKDPLDIVLAVLDDDLGALNTLAEAITGFYGLGETADAVKN